MPKPETLSEKFAGGEIERLRELLDDRDRWVPLGSLDVRDIGTVDTGSIGIIFLTPAFLLA